MDNQQFLAQEILGHGAYLCLRRVDGGDVLGPAAANIPALAERLGLSNEFDPGGPPPRDSIAFLRRCGASAGDLADEGVLQAEWVIHVASPRALPIAEFCDEAARLLTPAASVRILRGVVRPKNYTGTAMNNWAYARAVVQQPATVMPNAFLVPLSKTDDWWRKDWMERHTYFLPRYDDEGRMLSQGHALASAAGIPCLLRRTYRNATEPAAQGEYDFVTYFECADADVPLFHQVCAALRDVARNPEWRFVREGPTWHGRRVASWEGLFTTP
jgi:hypothetical protein